MITWEKAEIQKKPAVVPLEPPTADDIAPPDDYVGGSKQPANAGRAALESLVKKARKDAIRFSDSARAQVNLGVALLNAGDLSAAEDAFSRALSLDGTNSLARLYLARIAFRRGNLIGARREFSELHRSRPFEPLAVMGLADVSLQSNDLEGALGWCREAVGLAPKFAPARFQLGMVFLRLGQLQKSIHQLKAAVELDGRIPFLHYSLGMAYAIAKDVKRARREFQIALQLAPGMSEATRALSKVLLGEASPRTVRDLLVDHLETHPTDVAAREILAAAYFQEQDYPSARRQLYRTLSEMPDSNRPADRARIANNLGACYALLGDPNKAEHFFGLSIATYPAGGPMAFQNLARVHLGRQPEDALEVVEEGLRRYPDDPTLDVLRGYALAASERNEDAIAHLEALVDKGRGGAGPYACLGILLGADSDNARDFDRGVETLKAGLLKYPDDWLLLNNLSYVYLMNEDREAARPILERVPEQALNEPVIVATKGLLKLLDGDLRGGSEAYRRARALAEARNEPILAARAEQKMHLELARAFKRLNDHAEATQQLRQGLSTSLRSGSYFRELVSMAAEYGITSGPRREPAKGHHRRS